MIDLASAGVAVAFAATSFTFVHDVVMEGTFLDQIREWLYHESNHAVPVSQWMSEQMGTSSWGVPAVYHSVWVVAIAVVLFIGMQMMAFVYQALVHQPYIRGNRWLGAGLGFISGAVVVRVALYAVGSIAWIMGWESVDLWIGKSVVASLLIHS